MKAYVAMRLVETLTVEPFGCEVSATAPGGIIGYLPVFSSLREAEQAYGDLPTEFISIEQNDDLPLETTNTGVGEELEASEEGR